MSTRDGATALRRFGLGARPGEMARIAADARGFVLQALADPKAALIEGPALAPSHTTFTALLEAQRRLRLARAEAKEAPKAPADTMGGTPPAAAPAPPPEMAPQAGTPKPQGTLAAVRREAFLDEATARFERAIAVDAAFLERLVMFWSNHFCVAARGNVRGIAGAYEREAIRPHVLGRFVDMLLAAETHPAMLIYLDNQVSVGPNSRAGLNSGRGLNENLAREILELHTLGVGGGYGQQDVTNLARILTGWSVAYLVTPPPAEPGKFFFAPQNHEPGEWTVLGKRYPDQGARTGEQVLRDLARHRSTARHIAVKLARHFVAEQPPPALVDRLERTFIETDGDLAALARALVQADAAWAAPVVKVLPPYEFLVAVVRGLAIPPRPLELLRLCASLGQALWQPPAPAGWPDTDIAWAGPSALRERLRIAEVAARQVDRQTDPRAAAEDILGPALGAETRQAVARAEAREQGFELLIMSPDFQRR